MTGWSAVLMMFGVACGVVMADSRSSRTMKVVADVAILGTVAIVTAIGGKGE